VVTPTSALSRVTGAKIRLTVRPDLSERVFFLTVPFPATVISLCSERPVDAGSAQVRSRHDLARRLAGLFECFHPRQIDFGSPARLASLGGKPLLIATNALGRRHRKTDRESVFSLLGARVHPDAVVLATVARRPLTAPF